MIKLKNLVCTDKNSKLAGAYYGRVIDEQSGDLFAKTAPTFLLGIQEPEVICDYLVSRESMENTIQFFFWNKPSFSSRLEQFKKFIEVIFNTPQYNYGTEIVVMPLGHTGNAIRQPGVIHRTDGVMYDSLYPIRAKFFK